MHAFDGRTDRRTDRQTEFSSLDRVCIPCSAVKSEANVAVPESTVKFYGIIFFTFYFGGVTKCGA